MTIFAKTVFAKTALVAALAATVSLSLTPAMAATPMHLKAMNQTRVAVHPHVGPKSMTIGTHGQSNDDDDGTFCGNADVFVIYEEDENGNKVPGTEEYGCTD